MNQQATKKAKVQAGLALVVLTTAIIGSAAATRTSSSAAHKVVSPSSHKSAQPASSPAPTTSGGSTTRSTTATSYRDGTYSATGSYGSPAGVETIDVSVTLSANTITAATVVSEANDNRAQAYQDAFIDGYKSYVVGRDITTVKLSQVSGSSLTSEGFNNALDQIKRQAHS